MENEEKTPVVHEAFSSQPQAGQQPSAPSCNPKLPAPAPELVPLTPKMEELVEHAALRTDWKNTPIGR